MSNKYRLFSLVPANYVSPLQCGIQTAHAVAALGSKAWTDGPYAASAVAFDEWARNDKTIIVLNVSDVDALELAESTLLQAATLLNLPAASFREASLGGILTSVVIVLPIEIYSATKSQHGEWQPSAPGSVPYGANSLEASVMNILSDLHKA